jgi:serine/threonine protein kinase
MYDSARPIQTPDPPASKSGAGLPIAKGDVIAGKYEVEKVLGAGGCGVVVGAKHRALGERVAIKLLQRSAMRSPESVERFAREARAAARIKSEHVARVNDFGTTESGIPYMIMEHLEGEDLGALLARDKRVPLELAVDYVLMACDAVAEAHALGIVHRDLKPANLFVTRSIDGRPLLKVLDFGISKLVDGGEFGASVTQTQAVLGSPLYMSPEQMEASRDVDARADVWALGTILYQMLAGAPPFEAQTVPLLYVKVLSGEKPTPLADRGVTGVPDEVAAAIERCLSRHPEQRYPSVGNLALALAPYASPHLAQLAERIGRIAKAEQDPPSGVRRKTSVPPPPAARIPRAMLVAFACVAALGIGVGVAGASATRDDAPALKATRGAPRIVTASQLVAARAQADEIAHARPTPPGDAPEPTAERDPAAAPAPGPAPGSSVRRPPKKSAGARQPDVLDER